MPLRNVVRPAKWPRWSILLLLAAPLLLLPFVGSGPPANNDALLRVAIAPATPPLSQLHSTESGIWFVDSNACAYQLESESRSVRQIFGQCGRDDLQLYGGSATSLVIGLLDGKQLLLAKGSEEYEPVELRKLFDQEEDEEVTVMVNQIAMQGMDIWLATDNGLVHLRVEPGGQTPQKTIHHFPDSEGVVAVLSLPNGGVWAASQEQIFCRCTSDDQCFGGDLIESGGELWRRMVPPSEMRRSTRIRRLKNTGQYIWGFRETSSSGDESVVGPIPTGPLVFRAQEKLDLDQEKRKAQPKGVLVPIPTGPLVYYSEEKRQVHLGEPIGEEQITDAFEHGNEVFVAVTDPEAPIKRLRLLRSEGSGIERGFKLEQLELGPRSEALDSLLARKKPARVMLVPQRGELWAVSSHRMLGFTTEGVQFGVHPRWVERRVSRQARGADHAVVDSAGTLFVNTDSGLIELRRDTKLFAELECFLGREDWFFNVCLDLSNVSRIERVRYEPGVGANAKGEQVALIRSWKRNETHLENADWKTGGGVRG